jgi:hypothetical protein
MKNRQNTSAQNAERAQIPIMKKRIRFFDEVCETF